MKPKIDSLLRTDPEFVGSWKLIGRIGSGGYSTIFLAQKNTTKVAIKMLRRDTINSQKVFDRFSIEVKNLRQLQHPNIVQYIDSDISTQVPFIAMEYIEGRTLEQAIKSEGPLDEDSWLTCFRNVVSALDYCHTKNIIHKDLSPANIVIVNKIPKLIDFGFAYEKGAERLSAVDEVVGTDPYLSPEHFDGSEPIDAMDVFSLASTFVFAATGKLPFHGDKKTEIWHKIGFTAPDMEDLTRLQKSLLIPMLYKNPEDRPTLSQVNESIQNYKNSGDIGAYQQRLKNSHSQLIRPIVKNKSFITSSKKLAASVVVSLFLAASLILFMTTRSEPILKIDTQKYDKTRTSQSIQKNLDLSRDFFEKDDLINALKYAQLAADAGDAHGIYDVAFVQEKMGNVDKAEEWYLKAAKLNYGDAFLNLGNLYIDQKKYTKAIEIYRLGIGQNHLGSMNALAFYYAENDQISTAKDLYLQAANQGHAMSMFNYALLQQDGGDKASAKNWLAKALNAGYTEAAASLGFIYEKEADWVNARKYYEISTKSNDPYGMYNLAIVLGNHFSDKSSYPCDLLTNASNVKNVEQDLLIQINEAIAIGCANKNKISRKLPTSPSLIPKPNPSSSGSLTESPPEATNVLTKTIFGRPFDSASGLDWLVPLTSSNTELVPSITNLQFRLLGFSNKIWLDIGYKLKKSDYGVQAQVDKLFFEILFKSTVCPEFRFVRIENNLVTHIWTKALPECANDYTP